MLIHEEGEGLLNQKPPCNSIHLYRRTDPDFDEKICTKFCLGSQNKEEKAEKEMKFEFYDKNSEELTPLVIDSLWDQKIDMDDWDYMIFFAVEYEAQFPKGWDNVTLEPSNYNISRLLNGCGSNKWYPVQDFLGRQGILGIAYHVW